MLPLRAVRARPLQLARQQPLRRFHKSRSLKANPKEDHRAHTISQRLRQVRKIPPELIPLGVVLGVAIGAAIYSSIHKLLTDKTLRLKRSGGSHSS